MAKQAFTTGQVLTAAQMTSLQQTAMGGGSTTAKTASYTLVAADAGTVVQMNSASATTITVNTALFAAGDTVQIQNVGAGVCTVTAGTATVNTSSTLALKQYDAGQLYFNTTSAALFFATDAADISGGGKVLQVVNATTTTIVTNSTSTYADTTLTATITPTLNTSKVLVIALLNVQKGDANVYVQSALLRGASVIATVAKQTGFNGIAQNNNVGTDGITYLDSPATTSATTYKMQILSPTNAASVTAQAGNGMSSITLMEIGA
jgi:hypothetical protein